MFQEKIKFKKAEILKGFKIGQEKFNDERSYGHISDDSVNKYHLNENDPVLQWGMYFNYGNNMDGTKLNPLMDAIFKAKFSNDQIFLPESIKVFRVPREYVSDGHGNRYGIDDTPAGETENVYSLITSHNPSLECPDFEKYLQDSITKDTDGNPNGFSVNQDGQGKFYVPTSSGNDTDYSKYAYFIQVDTVLKNPKITPGGGTTLETHNGKFNGKGDTYESLTPWSSNTTGGGNSGKTPTSETKTKSINYQIQYVYKNGSLESNTPFNSSEDQTVQFRSTDNGTTWSSYSLDNGTTWTNLNGGNYQISLPDTITHNPKYTVYPNNITATLNNSSFTGFSDENGNVTITVASSTAKDGDTYIITVPYYTTEHADVRFWDDTDKTDDAINKLLKNNHYNLITTTDIDNDEHQGLADDYTNKDDNSRSASISFTNSDSSKDVDSIVNFLENHGYQFAGVTGDGSKDPNGAYSSVSYGKFDNNENVDQHFVLHFVHGQKTTTQTSTVFEKVTYYYENGPHIGSDVASPTYTTISPITFTRSVTKDDVTGNLSYGAWKINGSFAEIPFSKLPQNLKGTTSKTANDDVYKLDTNGTFKIINTTGMPDVTITKGADGNIGGLKYDSTRDKDTITSYLNKTQTPEIDIKVPYKLHEDITIHYIDENTGNEIDPSVVKSRSYTGDPNTSSNYNKDVLGDQNVLGDLDKLKSLGYIYDSGRTEGTADPVHSMPLSTYANKSLYKFTGHITVTGDKDYQAFSLSDLKFDDDEKPDNQNYYIFLYHGTKSVTEHSTVIENVYYRYANGLHGGDVVAGYPDKHVTVHYSRTGTYDATKYVNVTPTDSEISWGKWTPDENQPSFDGFTIPETVAGENNHNSKTYTLDYGGITVTKNGADVKSNLITSSTSNGSSVKGLTLDGKNETYDILDDLSNGSTTTYNVYVPYKLQERITVHYIDETNGKELKRRDYPQAPDNGDPYSITKNLTDQDITDLESKHYVFDKDATLDELDNSKTSQQLRSFLASKGYNLDTMNFKAQNANGININGYNYKNLVFDNDEFANNQIFYVYLGHATKDVTRTTTIQENIHGYYQDGDKLVPFTGINNSQSAVPVSDQTTNGGALTPNYVATITYTEHGKQDLVDTKTPPTWNPTTWKVTSGQINAVGYGTSAIPINIDGGYSLDKNGVVHITYDHYGNITNKISANQNGISALVALTPDTLTQIAEAEAKNKSAIPTINVWVPYVKNTPSGGGHHDGKTTPPPTPGNPTPPSTPTNPTVPTQPTKPVQPTKPQTSKPTTKKHVQKHHNRKPTPKPKRTPKKPNYNRNNRPHFENNRHGRKIYNHNITPRYQNGKFIHHTTTVVPHSLSTSYTPHTQKSNNNNVTPHSTSYVPAKNSNKVVNIQKNGKNISIKNANSSKLSELPQTGEEQDNTSKLGILGLAASAVLALFELAGDRKRKKN